MQSVLETHGWCQNDWPPFGLVGGFSIRKTFKSGLVHHGKYVSKIITNHQGAWEWMAKTRPRSVLLPSHMNAFRFMQSHGQRVGILALGSEEQHWTNLFLRDTTWDSWWSESIKSLGTQCWDMSISLNQRLWFTYRDFVLMFHVGVLPAIGPWMPKTVLLEVQANCYMSIHIQCNCIYT